MRDSEVIATSEFKQRIAETEFLASYVNDKDKEPIWDGSVHVYSDIDKKVEHDIGRVPVQVKGRTVKKLPKDKITFDEKHSNMVNFRNEGGVIYVVVKITPDNQKKMYYAKLMPFYINQLLSIYKDRKRVRFQLTLFPTDTKKIETLFYSFLQDRKKQPASLAGHNWTIEEIVKFNYSITGNLDERIIAIAFLIDMSNDSGFSINGGKIVINLDEAKTKISIEENKHTLKYLKDVKKMLDMVGVKQSMEIEKFTDKEENFIKGLVGL